MHTPLLQPAEAASFTLEMAISALIYTPSFSSFHRTLSRANLLDTRMCAYMEEDLFCDVWWVLSPHHPVTKVLAIPSGFHSSPEPITWGAPLRLWMGACAHPHSTLGLWSWYKLEACLISAGEGGVRGWQGSRSPQKALVLGWPVR